jgi:hypothetical protein
MIVSLRADCAHDIQAAKAKWDQLNHHRASGFCCRMISAQTRAAFVAKENRYTLLRIMR